MKINAPLRMFVLLICSSFLFHGCSSGPDDVPETGTVTGTVTLDGAPLADAQVQFQPENGRTSTGTTDAEGHYELDYSGTLKGAKIGKHSVSITTFNAPEGNLETKEAQKQVPKEKVPAQYNANTTLTADVKAGENTIDFDLQSK
ncbi:carboxypeptidase-like regulatory domain-containing protein [Gimesia sp.]|uniref:carboxypeptidase-like regulatory domain-containing protein n=1 Tax=Gimesia sp. TaxID=2024833 RepID=UPI0025BEB445|nr:carboxypeptidase-like regulatory domain-containing protein [Gimesia sp.]|tara:strand:- start:1387 stop:1821 length:435 start_codon:yes stop_codon:yes gene_type:complete